MRLLSSTPLPLGEGWDPEERRGELLLHGNEKYVAQSLSDSTVHVLDSNCVLLRTFVHPVHWAWGLAFDGENIVMTGSKDASLRVYHIPTGDLLHTLTCPHGRNVYRITSGEDNTHIIFATHFDGSICVWDIRTRTHLHTLNVHDQPAFRTNIVGDRLISSGPDGTISVWNWRSGQLMWRRTPGEPEDYETRSGNGVFSQAVWDNKVAAGTKDGNVWIWDLESGVGVASWRASESMIKNLVPYNGWLLQSSGGLLRIWSTDTFELLHTLRLFQRSCDKLGVLDGTVISCGRDASTAVENDVCGLDEAVKGWKVAWGERNEGDQGTAPERDREDVDEGQEISQGVFNIGLPTIQARGLVVLKDRVVISVMRRGDWVIEIWGNT